MPVLHITGEVYKRWLLDNGLAVPCPLDGIHYKHDNCVVYDAGPGVSCKDDGCKCRKYANPNIRKRNKKS